MGAYATVEASGRLASHDKDGEHGAKVREDNEGAFVFTSLYSRFLKKRMCTR